MRFRQKLIKIALRLFGSEEYVFKTSFDGRSGLFQTTLVSFSLLLKPTLILAKSLTSNPYFGEIVKVLTFLSGPTDVSIHSVAETLLLFLDSLRVPVIPDEFYRRCLDAAENEVACTQLMSALPPRLDH